MKTVTAVNQPLSPAEGGLPRVYHVVILGCRMSEYDLECMTGLLDIARMVPASSVPERATRATHAGDGGTDVVVLNTCSVQGNAADRLYGYLEQLAEVKHERPGIMIVVGKCFIRQEGSGILQRASWVDAILGTHNVDVLLVLLRHAELRQGAAMELEETLKIFPSMLPAHRINLASAWVSINVGYNNTCIFYIMPSLQGYEHNREPEEIPWELRTVVAQDAVGVTLLGQNVSPYDNGFGRCGVFAQLLCETGRIPRLGQLRLAFPHLATFAEDVIAAIVEISTVIPSLCFPLQSGSGRVLRQMRRSYRMERFLRILSEIHDTISETAIITDVIVGFPEEADTSFEATLRVMEQAWFSAAFTFIYSRRPGTPATGREGQVSSKVVSERY